MEKNGDLKFGRIVGWNLTLVGILVSIILSEKTFENDDYYFLLGASGVFTISILIFALIRPALYKLLSTNIAFEDFFSSKYSLGSFYDKAYSFVVIILVLMTIAYHIIDTNLSGSTQILSYTITTTIFILSAYFLSRIGSLKFNVLKQKLINEKLGVDVIVKSANIEIDLQDKKGAKAIIVAEYNFTCLKNLTYHELKSSLKAYDGELEILDAHNCSLHREGDGRINLRSIEQNLKEGETISYLYSALAKDVFPNDEEFWKIDLKHYTQSYKLTIKFHPDRPVQWCKCTPCSENESDRDSIPTPIVIKSNERDKVIFMANNLSTLECYQITWKW